MISWEVFPENCEEDEAAQVAARAVEAPGAALAGLTSVDVQNVAIRSRTRVVCPARRFVARIATGLCGVTTASGRLSPAALWPAGLSAAWVKTPGFGGAIMALQNDELDRNIRQTRAGLRQRPLVVELAQLVIDVARVIEDVTRIVTQLRSRR